VKEKILGNEQPREIDISEELSRGRLFNTPEGFRNCLISTSLSSPSSSFCSSCNYQAACITELKERDKSTALLRGYIKL